MSVKIFDTHALQTDVLCNINNRTNKGRRRQKSTGLLIPVPHCRCCPSRPQLLPVHLCQSLLPQPYALEVSYRVRKGLMIASRQPQLGGRDGQWWMMTTMTTATVAVDDHGGATPSPPAVPDCRRICVSLPPSAVGGVRPSGDDQRTGPPADSRCCHCRCRHRRRTTAMGTMT